MNTKKIRQWIDRALLGAFKVAILPLWLLSEGRKAWRRWRFRRWWNGIPSCVFDGTHPGAWTLGVNLSLSQKDVEKLLVKAANQLPSRVETMEYR